MNSFGVRSMPGNASAARTGVEGAAAAAAFALRSAAGFDAYLRKPIDPERLQELLNRFA